MQFRAVKGMSDILPDEVERWHMLEEAFRRLAELHRYAEIRTPVLEQTELFVRSIGETTDVVEKEMFTFQRSKESLTLRPEATAGAARAYVTNKIQAREPVSRWYYLGPMFRAEQPQRGRYRQFYQAGCEIFGDPGPVCDAEMIDMLCTLFGQLGIAGLEVCVSSLGGPETRRRYRCELLSFLRPRTSELSPHARERLEANPLRILDSKDPRDQEVAAEAPSILDLLEQSDRAHWDQLREALDALGTPYQVERSLMRGLDYYTRTLFEIRATTGDLGAQNTLVGGGRYDELVESLGGPAVPAIGFAMGLERILLAMSKEAPSPTPFCYLAPLGQRAAQQALCVARELRALGVSVDLDARGNSLKSMLRRADSLGARICLVVGESELERSVVQVKDLILHTQQEVPRNKVAAEVAGRLREAAVQTSPHPPNGGGA